MAVLGVFLLLIYLASGVWCVRCLLPRHGAVARVWMGLSLGFLLLMWLPALCAYALRFSLAAHAVSLAPLALVDLGCYLGRDRREARKLDQAEKRLLLTVCLVTVPLTVLGGYLQYTHTLRADSAGNLYVGQSTYGDLPMHLSFITGLRNAPFPPEYPIFPGHQLSYPYLTDTLSTTFLLFGWPLALSVTFPGTLLMVLCYAGATILTHQLTGSRKAALLAAALFFLNGGLGFLYDFDLAAGFEADGSLTVLSRLKNILEGYYKTPTNQPDPNNLRWSNLIADLLIPQRTLLGGYAMVIPCFYLLFTAFDPRKRESLGGMRPVVLLGLWAGALPLIHTHSFLALGLCSAGLLIYDLLHEKRLNTQYLVYAGLAVLLAAPQLFLSTFRQSFQAETNHSFLTFQFNWVNNRGGRGMRDFYFWFYIKNIGLPFVALILACFERNAKWRRILSGMALMVLAAELIRFQPNEYDNNKVFYLAWLLGCAVAADWTRMMWKRLKGLRARPVIAAAAAVAVFLSAGLTLWRECVSNYMVFNRHQADAAEWIEQNTPADAVFLSDADSHLNPVCSLAGRRVVCAGAGLWLYWHGFDTGEAASDIRAFYTDPPNGQDILDKYGVSYIYLSGSESYRYGVYAEDMAGYELLYDQGEIRIYRAKAD